MAPKKTLKRPASCSAENSECRGRPAKRPAAADEPAASKRPAAVGDDVKSSADAQVHEYQVENLGRFAATPRAQTQPATADLWAMVGQSRSAATPPAQGRPATPSTRMIKNVPENSTPTHEQVKVVRGVAVPTADWQVVPKGVACPAGCEYRMCMSSGVNMVRLLQSGAKSSRVPSNGSIVAVAGYRPSAPRTAASLAPLVDLTAEATPSRSSTSVRPATQDAVSVTRSALRAQLEEEIQHRRAEIQQRREARTARLQEEIQQRREARMPAARAPLQASGRTLPSSSSISSSSGNAGSGSACGPPPAVVRDVLPAGKSRTKVVDSEYKRSRVDTNKGGLQKEAQEHVKSRALIQRGESGKLSGQRKTVRKAESVEQLADGRTVVTETITLKKVTVLHKK